MSYDFPPRCTQRTIRRDTSATEAGSEAAEGEIVKAMMRCVSMINVLHWEKS